MSWRQKTFDVLPALTVRRGNLRQCLRRTTLAWMFGVVWSACISGSQMTLFARLLGFGYWHFGVLAAIPFAATLSQLIASVLVERTGLRKYPFIYFGTAHRLLWVAMAAVGLLMRPGPLEVTLFLALFAVSSVLGNMSAPSWQVWMADLIPRRIRGRYFAARTVWTLPVQVVVALGTGLLLDFLTRPLPPGTPITPANQPALVWAIAGLLAVGGIFGAIDILLFLTLREIVSPPLTARRPELPLGRNIVSVLSESAGVVADAFKDRVFRHYALYGATITFGIAVGGQFFWLYALENVHYNKLAANLVFLVLSSFTSFNVIRLWGRLIDRWGRRPILMISALGTVFSPIGWFLIPRDNLLVGYLGGGLTSILAGIMWSGVTLTQTNVMLGFSASPGRSRYMAAASVISAAGGILGGLAGGAIAEFFKDMQLHPLQVGPFTWYNYHVCFVISAAMRGLAVLWLIGMPEPGARPFRLVARDIFFNAFNNVATRLLWPVRALRTRDGHKQDVSGPFDTE